TASDWSAGVVGTLATATRPSASTDTRSVNVPPTSMPMRSMPSASLGRDEPHRHIAGALLGAAQHGLPPAAAAARMVNEHVAAPQHDPRLFGLEQTIGMAV